MRATIQRARAKFIRAIYANHNDSQTISRTLSLLFEDLPPDGKSLNVGSGSGRLHSSITNLDIIDGDNIDVVGRAESLPFRDAQFDLVVTQETLEHVADPFTAVREAYRVLKPNGRVYVQVPFVIGYHPGPTDYWRFTREGVVQIVEQAGFSVECVGISVGPAVGFYRIAVEFFAIVTSALIHRLYYPAKAAFAVLLYPVKLLDRVLTNQPDRVAGGYFVVAVKPSPENDVTVEIDSGNV